MLGHSHGPKPAHIGTYPVTNKDTGSSRGCCRKTEHYILYVPKGDQAGLEHLDAQNTRVSPPRDPNTGPHESRTPALPTSHTGSRGCNIHHDGGGGERSHVRVIFVLAAEHAD